MKKRTLLLFSCLLEVGTGIALIVVPSLVADVLLASTLNPTGKAVARMGGLGLLSLAIACWPRGELLNTQTLRALTLYNLAAGCFFTYLRVSGEFASIFLLPVGILHLLFALIPVRAAFSR